MTIQVKGEKIVTTIYAKPLALYQYIPPNSCHPPGVLTGLIFGQILQIYKLCFQSKDIDKELSLFHTRLQNHGYASKKLLPLFKKGINNAIFYLSQTQEQRDATKKAKIGKSDRGIFLHIPYHPPKPLIWIRSKTLAKPSPLAARQREPQPADQLGGTSCPIQEACYRLSSQS